MSTTTPAPAPKISIGKHVRLFDFKVYDRFANAHEDPDDDPSLSGDSENTDSSCSDPRRRRKKKTSKEFSIQMFGITENGETVSITVTDYQPFFFVKVPDTWTEYETAGFWQHLRELQSLSYCHRDIVDVKLIQRHKLYGFTAGKKHNFVYILFKNMQTFNRVKNLWYITDKLKNRRLIKYPYGSGGKVKLELYESNIPPLLRYFHIHSISPSGWIFLKTPQCKNEYNKHTTCHYEFSCRKKAIEPAPNKESRVPYKICSYDIEASSSHGDFPIPVKSYKKLATNLVDLFTEYQTVEPNMEYERGASLFRSIVMSAFGYGKFNHVDLVYPIEKPDRTMTDNYITHILQSSINRIKPIAGANSRAATIEKMFEEMKIRDTVVGGTHYGEDDGDSDSDAEVEDADYPECEDDSQNPEEEEEEETSSRQVSTVKTCETEDLSEMLLKNKATKKIPSHTIVHLLLSRETERDEKIQKTTDAFGKIFPKLEGDKVTFIGSTFLRYGETEPYKNHCVVLGDCDPVEGCEIVACKTETDLLLKWRDIIQQENPDIIIGYNIFGFDYEFLFRRSQENHCEKEFMRLSRNHSELSMVPARGTQFSEGIFDLQNTVVALASGEYDLRYPLMTGRLQIDMLTYCRREFQWTSYKLDDVASMNIGDDVKHIAPATASTTNIYSQNLIGLHVGDYIHLEIIGFSSDYYDHGRKFRVVDLKENTEYEKDGKTTKTNCIVVDGHWPIDFKKKKIKWGMAKDDVSPSDIFRLSNGTAADRAIVAKYCIQDCNLVHHLMRKMDVLTGYIEMSNICSVPISFLVFRGQGIKLTSFVAKKCREKNTLMPDLDKCTGDGGYEGAIVLPPKCSMYMDNPVACVDYSSLYPSSMISQNYSHDSKVWSKEYDLEGNLIKEWGEKDRYGNFIYDHLPGYEYITMEFDTYRYIRPHGRPTAAALKTKVGKQICCWAQLPDNQKSIMPSILEELLKARKDTRNKAKTYEKTDPFMSNVLDKRQLGYKVTANSLYGQCGARTSTFYEKDVAACTTATGRMMITYAKRIIEEVYGDLVYETAKRAVKCRAEYVYGDTDSVFFTFNLEDVETGEKIRGKEALEMTIEIAKHAAELCTRYLKPPMELSYEKTLMPFILLSKKRYVGMLYEEDPNKGKLKFMGLVLKRRDNCDLVKDVYGGVLDILMKGETSNGETTVQAAIDFLHQSLNELIQGKYPMDKLTITKALRSYYKNPSQIAHRVLADRIAKRDPGNKPKSGDRIKYAYINVNSKKGVKLLQGDKIETPEFIQEHKLQINYTHYITNQLMKPLQQLFGLALEQIWRMHGNEYKLKQYKTSLLELEKDCAGNLEIFMKKKEKIASSEIKQLLFDEFLTKIYQTQNRIRTLDSFWNKK